MKVRDSVLAMLPTMSVEDLITVQAVATKLIGARTVPQTGEAGRLPAIFFEALSGPLNATQPYAKLAGTKWGKQFEGKVPDLAKWLDQHFDGWSKNKVTQLAFLRMLFSMMANDLKRRNLPRSLAMAVTNLEQIPRIVENGYPGYLDAGMGKLILKSFQPPL